jgi:hypothetical protein
MPIKYTLLGQIAHTLILLGLVDRSDLIHEVREKLATSVLHRDEAAAPSCPWEAAGSANPDNAADHGRGRLADGITNRPGGKMSGSHAEDLHILVVFAPPVDPG